MSRDRTAYRAQAVVPPCRLGIDEQTYLKGDVWGEPLSRPMSPSGTMHKCVDPRSADRAPISRAAQPVSQPKGQLLARNRRPIFAPQPWGSLLLLRQREARCYPAVAAEELTQQFGAIALLTPV